MGGVGAERGDAMRFGLVGTGYWAWVTHAAGLSTVEGAELAAVWGRNPDRTATLAKEFGAEAAPSFPELVESVDAVAFAVPPDIQADLAVEAARAGRHLLLEKPVATRPDAADRLVDAVDAAGVASVVFFTARFDPARSAWLDDVTGVSWGGAWARWLTATFFDGSPYAGSSWRRERGGLWDVAPHLLAILLPVLGPVEGVTARAGAGDLAHLILAHAGGATSTISVTLGAPRRAISHELTLWGDSGVFSLPPMAGTAKTAFAQAARELMESAAAGGSHPVDVHLGREVSRVLADVEAQLAA